MKRVLNGISENIFELFLLMGLGGLFYGLYLEKPWLAFVVTGSLFVILGTGGILMSGKGDD